MSNVGKPIQLSESEQRAERTYRAALARGRLATQHKDFDAADRAFGEALVAHPHDARALGERGYERLQANRLDDAREDFRAAEGRAGDPELAAQIYFNQGLTAERLGEIDMAKVAYARSQAAHATAAAAKKVAQFHGSACTTEVITLNQPAQHFANWIDFWKIFGHFGHDEVMHSDDEVKAMLVFGECKDYCVAGLEDWHLVFPSTAGLDVIRGLDYGGSYGRCGGQPDFTFEQQGNFLHIISTRTELILTSPDSCAPGNCQSFCADGPAHRYDIIIDLNAHRAVLRVSQYGPLSEKFEALPITFKSDSVTVTGNGCDRTIPLVPSTK